MSGCAVEMRGISASFSGVPALSGVSLRLLPGRLHALLGESGAGKTTLARVLAGLAEPDGGDLLLHDRPADGLTPRRAAKGGVGLALRPDETLAGFSALAHARASLSSPRGKRAMLRELEAVRDRYGLSFDARVPSGQLLPDQRLAAETARLLVSGADILIYDEPEDFLSPLEMDALRALWRRLGEEGKTILHLTRHPAQAALADQCTVIRGGVIVETVQGADLDAEALGRAMMGKKEIKPLEKREIGLGSVVLEARDVSAAGEGEIKLKRVSLEARSAEITAVLGMPNGELSLLGEALAGVRPLLGGKLRLRGQDVSALSARDRGRAGIAYLPGEEGLAPSASLSDNLLLGRYREAAFQESGLRKWGEIRRYSENLLDACGIGQEIRSNDRADTLPPASLRLLALEREIDRNGEVLLAVEPARGLAAGAAAEIHERLLALRDSRRSVLLLTSDIQEALEIADRVLVMCQGEMAGEFFPGYISAQELGLYRSGERRQGGEEQFDEE